MFLLVLIFPFVFAGISNAQESGKEPPKEEIVTETKDVTGRVSGMSHNFIAITYGQSQDGQAALEMAFNLDSKIRVGHKNSLKEIKMDDMVQVTYDEITTTKADGSKSFRRVARVVTFLRPAQKQVEPSDAGGVLQSQGQEAASPLTIKGTK